MGYPMDIYSAKYIVQKPLYPLGDPWDIHMYIGTLFDIQWKESYTYFYICEHMSIPRDIHGVSICIGLYSWDRGVFAVYRALFDMYTYIYMYICIGLYPWDRGVFAVYRALFVVAWILEAGVCDVWICIYMYVYMYMYTYINIYISIPVYICAYTKMYL